MNTSGSQPNCRVLSALLAGFLVCFPLGCRQADPPPSELPEQDSQLAALKKAAHWLAAFPEAELKFDAAIGLQQIGILLPEGPFEKARLLALKKAQRDDDNPLQRLWNDSFEASPAQTRQWAVPLPGENRVNVNRPVIEALYCDRNGLREESLAYITGPMRDSGGYHSTHALWALVIAHERGCLSDARFDQLSRPLRAELRLAQSANPLFKKTLDVDLYAERTLMLLLAKDTQGSQKWVQQLLQHQNEDGSWGAAAENEPAYYRYHATLVCCWALAAHGND